MQNKLLEDFVDEIKIIQKDLTAIVDTQLRSVNMERVLFEKFGQLIDRIYGTAITLGFKEIGEYFFAIKKITYLSSQCEHETTHMKVLQIMIECSENIEKICKSIYDKVELENLKNMFIAAIAKAENLIRNDFDHINPQLK